MIRDDYLRDVLSQLRKYKELAERAMAQVSDEQLFMPLAAESNSIAIVVKHVAGNMRSRWTDFLTTDGEKPDRHRDGEFLLSGDDTADALRQAFDSDEFQSFNEKKYMHLVDSYRDTAGSRELITETIGTYKAVYKDLGILK